MERDITLLANQKPVFGIPNVKQPSLPSLSLPPSNFEEMTWGYYYTLPPSSPTRATTVPPYQHSNRHCHYHVGIDQAKGDEVLRLLGSVCLQDM